jgi:hypothetical protein
MECPSQLAEVHLASCDHEGPEPAGAIRFVGVTPGAPPSSRSCDATATMLPSDLLLLLPAAATAPNQAVPCRRVLNLCLNAIQRHLSVKLETARWGSKLSWQCTCDLAAPRRAGALDECCVGIMHGASPGALAAWPSSHVFSGADRSSVRSNAGQGCDAVCGCDSCVAASVCRGG